MTNVSAQGRIRPAPVENGCSFVATQTMTVTQLCRFALPNDNNVETVAIFAATSGAIISLSRARSLDCLFPAHSLSLFPLLRVESGNTAAPAAPLATAEVDALSKERDEHGFVCAAVAAETTSQAIYTPPVLTQGQKWLLLSGSLFLFAAHPTPFRISDGSLNVLSIWITQ